jgi:hypothetical protein
VDSRLGSPKADGTVRFRSGVPTMKFELVSVDNWKYSQPVDAYYDITVTLRVHPGWLSKTILRRKPKEYKVHSVGGITWQCMDDPEFRIPWPGRLSSFLDHVQKNLGWYIDHLEGLRAAKVQREKILAKEKELQDIKRRSRFERLQY